ncbi:MAG: hypothetical protein WCA91_06680, partial [Candidatus Acidiferrales bacterium]
KQGLGSQGGVVIIDVIAGMFRASRQISGSRPEGETRRLEWQNGDSKAYHHLAKSRPLPRNNLGVVRIGH